MGDQPLGLSLPSGEFSNQPLHSKGSIPQHTQTSSYHDGGDDNRRGGYGQQSLNIAHGSYSAQQPFSPPQQGPQGRHDSFGMAPLGAALPDVLYHNFSNVPSQRYQSSPSASQHMYPLQGVAQFPSPQGMGQIITYNTQYPAPYPIYGQSQNASPPNPQSGHSLYQQQAFVGQQQVGAPFFSQQQSQYAIQSQMYMGGAGPAQFPLRGTFSGENRLQTQQSALDYSGSLGPNVQGKGSASATVTTPPSTVRGPPRKPRQSGHAIWIGNLPPQTDLMSLVLHVSKETSGLESLFLISKSNCAFANFKNEESCTTAQVKIHDSRFQTVRLVSRLRRQSVGTAAGTAVPTGAAVLSGAATSPTTLASSLTHDAETKEASGETGTSDAQKADDSALPKDKYFIVKSLTVEDLELSVRNGIWATQSHNEDSLNKAYQTADNVYLVFSANKSGEYFGYAKMISPINDDPAAAIEFAPKAHTVEDPELPKAIPTAETDFAPKGRIIDDSARGTIFWEVEREDEEEGDEDDSGSNRSGQDGEPSSPSKAWGKPFQVEWVSTTRLPFYRTRGLRNPWNSNREIKIARDGTELETAIGRRLLGLFHRVPSPIAPNNTQAMLGNLPLMGAYPQMRPFHQV